LMPIPPDPVEPAAPRELGEAAESIE